MSEFQYIAFRAIDGPVSATNLKYMREQSTRAEITPWAFDNQYTFGDFHGNAEEMLRRGYDFHFHYADFGIRKLMFRIPTELPPAAKMYLMDDSLAYSKDKTGRRGILTFDLSHEPGDLEDVFEPEELLERLLPLRAEILEGDLRPLYLAHLALASDMNHDPYEESDAPVPAGLEKLTDAQKALAEFYGLDEATLAAAAEGAPPLLPRGKTEKDHESWLRAQPDDARLVWLRRLMEDEASAVRSEMLQAFRESQSESSWPTLKVDRTIGQILTRAEALREGIQHEKARQKARKRADWLASLAADPDKALRKAESLVEERSLNGYQEAAELLADLREALAGTARSNLATQHARRLKERNPKRNHLIAALKNKGLL